MIPTMLLSNWYSGATLFAFFLDSHPEIICNGETFPLRDKDKRRNICSCGAYIDTCDFYKNTIYIKEDETFPRNWDYNNAVVKPRLHNNILVNRYLSSPLLESFLRRKIITHTNIKNRLNSYINYQFNFMENALNYSDANVYVDGTKSIRRTQIFANHFRNEKLNLIHLVRDGRAFCNSYKKNRKLTEKDLNFAAQEWNDYIQLVDNLANKFSNVNTLTIRYEDLCNNKHRVGLEISKFLKLSSSKKFEEDNSTSHILGNRMRKDFNFDIVEDLSWKQELSENTISAISKVMKKNLHRFNYL
ncbi:sulfotransferase domain-containing protein [Salinimonas marina]|uniref:Sulfotransferase domain-containing protein n=1 Tax=Salinimonas marina TaxID=2785918 RepID=A0A7S9DZ03_9ALTE|nr:sulfotransferase domain-containing protein [Salinimonas marina]QPG06422.1 sulfotransferase domain-containing protein [Salinimonas marina]